MLPEKIRRDLTPDALRRHLIAAKPCHLEHGIVKCLCRRTGFAFGFPLALLFPVRAGTLHSAPSLLHHPLHDLLRRPCVELDPWGNVINVV